MVRSNRVRRILLSFSVAVFLFMTACRGEGESAKQVEVPEHCVTVMNCNYQSGMIYWRQFVKKVKSGKSAEVCIYDKHTDTFMEEEYNRRLFRKNITKIYFDGYQFQCQYEDKRGELQKRVYRNLYEIKDSGEMDGIFLANVAREELMLCGQTDKVYTPDHSMLLFCRKADVEKKSAYDTGI